MPEVLSELVANVWKVVVAAGQAVAAGDPLVILESMKVEIPVESPADGTVIEVREGGVVQEGNVIAVIEQPGLRASMAAVALIRSNPGRVWRLILDRPEARNAVSEPMLGELLEALRDAATDPEARVILLSGEGPAFCAGADLGELDGAAQGPGGFRYEDALEEVLEAIADHPVPVVAAIHGAALGAGCQIVVACDLAVAEAEASIGIPSSRLGIVISFENIQRLVLSVGPRRAADMLLTGRALSGEEAARWGMVNEAVPAGALHERAEALAEAIASNAPLSVRGSKRGIRAVLQKLSLDRMTEGHRVADFDMMAAEAFASEDLKEGVRAFRERRPPEFRGK